LGQCIFTLDFEKPFIRQEKIQKLIKSPAKLKPRLKKESKTIID